MIYVLLTLMTAARISWISRGLRSTIYRAVSSDSQVIGPSTAGASLSGEEIAEELLCRLSFEDLGLSVCVDMINVLCKDLSFGVVVHLCTYNVFIVCYGLSVL